MPTNQLDVLLIAPGNRMQIYQGLGSDLAGIEPPIWASLLATFLRRRGISVAIIDANAEGITPEQCAQQAAEMAPLLTAIISYGHQPSASTQVMPYAGALCTAMHKSSPQLKTILVGGHVAALPERTAQEEDADFICSGEGPYTLLELIEAIKSNQTDYSKVRGLVYWEGDQLRSTPAAPLVTKLDEEMPEMAWDLLPMNKYRAHNWQCFGHLDKRSPYGSIYTTLGCPYHCTYCCIQAPFKSGENALGMRKAMNSYRFWSPQSVIAQIDKMVNDYGIYNIKFADELFVMHRKHVETICDLIIERGYKVNIWAYARLDTVREEGMLEKLKAAGFHWVSFGIESANARVRDDVLKSFEQDTMFRVIQRVRDVGINIIANYIFGLPEDDVASMQQTLDLAVDLNCEFANFYCAMAYPGSQLYQTALDAKWPLPSSWSGYSQHAVDTIPLPTRHISGAEVLRFRDNAFNFYFNNPKYLKMIEEKFGVETVNHVKQMASHKLKRQYADAK